MSLASRLKARRDYRKSLAILATAAVAPPMHSTPEPTPERGVELAEEGCAKVLAGTSDTWKDAFLEAIMLMSGSGRTNITTDDVLDYMSAEFENVPQPSHPNALGAAIRTAVAKGLIYGTGSYVKSRRPSAHARLIQLWTLRRQSAMAA